MSVGRDEGNGNMQHADRTADALADSKKHILFIAAHFAPESTSGTHRSLHFARSLHDAGFNVSVVTVDGSSLNSVDPQLNAIFPYEHQILRVPLRATVETTYLACKKPLAHLAQRLRGNRKPGEILPDRDQKPTAEQRNVFRNELSGALSFPDRFRGWYRPAVEAACTLSGTAPVHAVFASGPPWTALMVARTVSQRLNCKLITDFRDPWTRKMGYADPPLPRIYSAWAEREEEEIIGRSTALLFNSPDLMSQSRRNYTNLPAIVHCLLNGTDLPARPTEGVFPPERRLAIRHFGSLYGGRTVQPLVKAIAAAGLDTSRIAVELVGTDTDISLHSRVDSGVSVGYLGMFPHSEAARLMDTPAILLAVQSPNFSAQIPTKLYEYLRTGNPILVLADEDSAAWRFASQFRRCFRLDFEDTAANSAILGLLFSQWMAGKLMQVSTCDDTADLGKGVIGLQFAALMSKLLSDEPRPGESTRRITTPAWQDTLRAALTR